MLIEHAGAAPRVHPSAYVAPTAVLCGDVEVGADCRILFGAVLTAEDGPVRLGERCIVMENAVLRGRAGHPVRIGDRVLIGPHAHVNGAEVGDEAFIATGASLFPGSPQLDMNDRRAVSGPAGHSGNRWSSLSPATTHWTTTWRTTRERCSSGYSEPAIAQTPPQGLRTSTRIGVVAAHARKCSRSSSIPARPAIALR